MKRTRPTISTSRAVAVFQDMVQYRRNFRADTEFFRMPEIWEELCDEEGRWSMNFYRSPENEEFNPKAGIIAFDDRVTLTVDEKLMVNARRGSIFANFILAHEFAHLALDHHNRSAETKNFQLQQRPDGPANVPPTTEEYEANFAAVCFQCGVALLESRWNPVDLAKRASSDVHCVRKFQAMIQLDVFRRELERQREVERQRPKPTRVVL